MVGTDTGDPRVPVERATSASGWALEVFVGARMAPLLHVGARACMLLHGM